MYDLVSCFIAYAFFIVQTTHHPKSKSDRDTAYGRGGGGCNSTIKTFPPTIIRYPVKKQWDDHTPETKNTHTYTHKTHMSPLDILYLVMNAVHICSEALRSFFYEVDALYSPPYICLVDIFACDSIGCVFLLHLS